jgi:hypothetical protein
MIKPNKNTVVEDRERRYEMLKEMYSKHDDLSEEDVEKEIKRHIRFSNRRSLPARKLIKEFLPDMIKMGFEFDEKTLRYNNFRMPMNGGHQGYIHCLMSCSWGEKLEVSFSHYSHSSSCSFHNFKWKPTTTKEIKEALRMFKNNVKRLKDNGSIVYGIFEPWEIVGLTKKGMLYKDKMWSKEIKSVKDKKEKKKKAS